jgi:hypothetical protein
MERQGALTPPESFSNNTPERLHHLTGCQEMLICPPFLGALPAASL